MFDKNAPISTVLKKSPNYSQAVVNSVIISEGISDKSSMYIILSGKAKVYKDYNKPNQILVSELKEGDFFGEMSLFLNKLERSATIVAASHMELYELTKENADYFFSKSPDAAYKIMQTLCYRIDVLNKNYVDLVANYRSQLSDTELKTEIKSELETDIKTVESPEAVENPKALTSLGLFPKGHKNYVFPEANRDMGLIHTKELNCPICGSGFDFPVVRESKLKKESLEYDMRTIYQGIDLTHYFAATCPKCFFSSIVKVFEKASDKKAAEIKQKGLELRGLVTLLPTAVDANSVFTRLYLALEFVPLCYREAILYKAQLWLNISWLYRDCGDSEMEKFALIKAHEGYLSVYTELNLDSKNMQRICMILGELCYKKGDISDSRRFFHAAKTNRDGYTELTEMAEDRLNIIRANLKEGN